MTATHVQRVEPIGETGAAGCGEQSNPASDDSADKREATSTTRGVVYGTRLPFDRLGSLGWRVAALSLRISTSRDRRDSGAAMSGVDSAALLNACIPFITAIFPVAAFTAAEMAETLYQLDPLDIFGVLVAQLAFNAQPERSAVAYL